MSLRDPDHIVAINIALSVASGRSIRDVALEYGILESEAIQLHDLAYNEARTISSADVDHEQILVAGREAVDDPSAASGREAATISSWVHVVAPRLASGPQRCAVCDAALPTPDSPSSSRFPKGAALVEVSGRFGRHFEVCDEPPSDVPPCTIHPDTPAQTA